MSVKYKRLLNRTHKKHEPQSSLVSYALRCSYKLQEIQSLEILFQWLTKVHKYLHTQTHNVFVFFFLFILKNKQNKD